MKKYDLRNFEYITINFMDFHERFYKFQKNNCNVLILGT